MGRPQSEYTWPTGKPGCREWQGPRNEAGYGSLQRGKQKKLVHRHVWELANGSIPRDMEVMHLCDNPPCFLLAHLQLGTRKDNAQDMRTKKRHSYGETHVTAKLTQVQVDEIRERWNWGERVTALAQEFGVTHQQISKIINEDRWPTA